MLRSIYTALFLIFICKWASAESTKPNIVLIFNDDLGYNDLGCFGSTNIKTPRIDQLASEGIKFTDFYVPSAVCSASRASLMTGSYNSRVKINGALNPSKDDEGLDPKYVTIAEVLKSVGYKTMAVGKWHLGDAKRFLPTNQGFDSYYGIPYSNDMKASMTMEYAEDCLYREGFSADIFKPRNEFDNQQAKKFKFQNNKVPLMRDEKVIEIPVDQRTITKRYANEGIQFISDSVKANQPFFLYLANSMPHTPLYVTPEFEGVSESGLYGDVMAEIDYNVGRVIDHLKKLKIEKETLVIFTSDNGPWLIKGTHGGSAYPYFEGKRTNFEGGNRVPTIMRWPGMIPKGKICSEIASTMDFMPTFAHLSGAELPNVTPIDGKNILDLMLNKEGAVSPHEYFVYGGSAIRVGHWKFHKKERYKVAPENRRTKESTLYNLKNDPNESKNLIKQNPEIAKRLNDLLTKHLSKLK